MSDEQTPRSGSRWEPTPGVDPDNEETTRQPAGALPAAATAAPSVEEPSDPSEPAAKRGWTSRMRSRGGLVGAALALVLVSGLGGFAIGNATAGPDRFGMVGGDFHGGPGGGFPGGDGDRDGDGPPGMHREGFGTPPRGDDDSTTPDDDSISPDDDSDDQSGSTL